MANNHSQDYGQTGYDDTIAALDAEGCKAATTACVSGCEG
ncbi:MAG: hypothetical protein ACLUE1_01260 [Adlercreutzia equolifaciens]